MRCTLPQNLFNEFFKSNSVRLICSNIESFFLAAFIFKIFIRFNTHNTFTMCIFLYNIYKKNINKKYNFYFKKIKTTFKFQKNTSDRIIIIVNIIYIYIFVFFFILYTSNSNLRIIKIYRISRSNQKKTKIHNSIWKKHQYQI